jgi:hypothetical protein
MFILRLIVVVLAALVVRRLVRAAFAPARRSGRNDAVDERGGRRNYRDLTQQDVSDADYEEIP